MREKYSKNQIMGFSTNRIYIIEEIKFKFEVIKKIRNQIYNIVAKNRIICEE